jgi:hypothetical protein
LPFLPLFNLTTAFFMFAHGDPPSGFVGMRPDGDYSHQCQYQNYD